MENCENKLIWPERVAWTVCKDGEEMMRSASCFIILILVISYMFPKRQVSQTPHVYTRVFLIWAPNPTLHTNAHKMVNSMAPNSDCKWCQTPPIWPIIASHLSLHPFQTTIFTISCFGSTQESFYQYCTCSGHSPFSIFLPYKLIALMFSFTTQDDVVNAVVV